MLMFFGTLVSKIAPMGGLHQAKPAPLCCGIDPSHVGTEHPSRHPKLTEPYGVRALLLPDPTCCFLGVKRPFFPHVHKTAGYLPSPCWKQQVEDALREPRGGKGTLHPFRSPLANTGQPVGNSCEMAECHS